MAETSTPAVGVVLSASAPIPESRTPESRAPKSSAPKSSACDSLKSPAPVSDARYRVGRTSFGAALLTLGFALGEGRAAAQTATPKVEAVYPHDTGAFTEGLELFEGKLFESTGLNNKSTVRRVELTTGVVEKSINLDSSLFGEGMTRIDRTLIQLTYTTGIAIVYDLDTFAEIKRFTYTGQGWGICYDGTDLVMTNGTDKLFFRDPVTFALRREVTVRHNGTAIDNLNELECVGSVVYINEWRTDNILRVDKATGNVLTLIDGSALLTADEKKNVDVLNGIAYDQAKRRFYLTGKYWPKLFEVSFDFEPGGEGDAGIADAGGTADAGNPGDAGANDAAADRAVADAGARDTSAPRDAPDAGARDASSSDARSNDATSPDAVQPPPDVAADVGNGTGGAGGSTGTGGSNGDPGAGAPNEGCACSSAAAPNAPPWHVVAAGLAALILAVARPLTARYPARIRGRSRRRIS